jgi:dGTP triphosphohydrolase
MLVRGPLIRKGLTSFPPKSDIDRQVPSESFKEAVAADEQNRHYHKVQLVTDYVAGMTDTFALSLHKGYSMDNASQSWGTGTASASSEWQIRVS